MTAHEVLVAARNMIDRDGWMRLAFSNEGGGPYCAVGALHRTEASASSPEVREAKCTLARTVGLEYGFDVIGWNDEAGRTKHEVLAAFDKAIAATAPEPKWDSLTPQTEAEPESVPKAVSHV